MPMSASVHYRLGRLCFRLNDAAKTIYRLGLFRKLKQEARDRMHSLTSATSP